MSEQHPDLTPPGATDQALLLQAKTEHEKALAKVEPDQPTVELDGEGDMTVIARNPREMAVANKHLIAWTKRKIELHKKEMDDHLANFNLAKKRKIKSDAYDRMAKAMGKKIEFYVKLQTALELGYCIVPDVPMDVFAVRTTRKNPVSNLRTTENTKTGYQSKPNVPDQTTSCPPAGEGKYVSPAPFFREARTEYKTAEGKDMVQFQRWATEFDDVVDFPFKLAKPAILNDTARAMTEKVFDEIGVLPATPKADPMVIGRIKRRVNGYTWKSICFVISWYIDTKDL